MNDPSPIIDYAHPPKVETYQRKGKWARFGDPDFLLLAVFATILVLIILYVVALIALSYAGFIDWDI